MCFSSKVRLLELPRALGFHSCWGRQSRQGIWNRVQGENAEPAAHLGRASTQGSTLQAMSLKLEIHILRSCMELTGRHSQEGGRIFVHHRVLWPFTGTVWLICRGLGEMGSLQKVFLASKSTRRQCGGSTPCAAAQGPRLEKGEV